ncbi:Alpha/beta hydrolase fold-3 [Penicillium occitanis (nom. inval.)]|nr:Alpha/beta hydrolase fold-3 [Penicillium occitanis (nom. inval.)]PCG97396.1 hypothetical protein PENOC_068140 [Penicillium occitanis (nom. inval.)]
MHDITTIHSSGADKPDYLNTGLGLSVSLDNVPSQGYLSDPVEEWEIFYKENHSIIPSYEGPLEQLRAIYNSTKRRAAESRKDLVADGLRVEDIEIPTPNGDGRIGIKLRIYKPVTEKSTDSDLPVLIYLHGGGWTLGNLDADDSVCRSACKRCNTVVVSVDYALYLLPYSVFMQTWLIQTRAPEFPYPSAILDVWESLNWVPGLIWRLSFQAAVVTRKAITGGIPISGTLLQIPVVCHRNCYPSEEYELQSMHQNKDAPLLSRAALDQFWAYYNPPNIADLQVSPLLAKDFTGFPRTFIQICGLDPLRDEGLAYATKLWGFDVPCSVVVYPGLPHGFNAFTELPAAKAYHEDMLKGLDELISGEIANGIRNYHGK